MKVLNISQLSISFVGETIFENREFDSCIKMKFTKASHRLIFLSNFSFFTFVPFRTVL